MIVARLRGGLGNQLFQYAAARRLALHLGADLKLDISDLTTGSRRYALGAFATVGSVATGDDLRRFRGPHRASLRKVYELLGIKWSYVEERHFQFDPDVLKLSGNVYLSGYWQSERYFLDVEHVIRGELMVRAPLAGRSLELAREIERGDAVSLHVRRGDYVTNSTVRRAHGVVPMDYYERSVEEMAGALGSLKLFVFTDDPSWVRDHLHFPWPTTVVGQTLEASDHEDLRLMSLCQHHIIANSTFSWWGAWLGYNPDRIVIAPRSWFAELRHETSDLIPQGWRLR